MTRLSKAQRAKYNHVVGSRREVHNGSAHHTTGGLTKKDLFFNNKTGRIVSMKKHKSAKKEQRLRKHGYGAKKGKFGYVLLNGHKGKKTMKKRGGYAGHLSLSPANFDGAGVGTSGDAVQFEAGQAGGSGLGDIFGKIKDSMYPPGSSIVGGRRRRSMKKRGGIPEVV